MTLKHPETLKLAVILEFVEAMAPVCWWMSVFASRELNLVRSWAHAAQVIRCEEDANGFYSFTYDLD